MKTACVILATVAVLLAVLRPAEAIICYKCGSAVNAVANNRTACASNKVLYDEPKNTVCLAALVDCENKSLDPIYKSLLCTANGKSKTVVYYDSIGSSGIGTGGILNRQCSTDKCNDPAKYNYQDSSAASATLGAVVLAVMGTLAVAFM